MTDRLKGFIVVLEKDLRIDDAESTIQAIKQIRGVVDVVPMKAELKDTFERSRLKHEMFEKVLTVIRDL